jgi:hypothetical protein
MTTKPTRDPKLVTAKSGWTDAEPSQPGQRPVDGGGGMVTSKPTSSSAVPDGGGGFTQSSQ